MTSSVILSLPKELVMEIMSRVPGKTVARTRSVSKQFKSLLSDPCFLRLHHNRSLDSLFALRDDWGIGRAVKNCSFTLTNKANGLVHGFSLDFDSALFRMLSSYHQLVCFVCETSIYLCNPVNKELKKLPMSTSCFTKSGSLHHLVSFGFVNTTKQYKLVKWPHDLEEKCRRRFGLKFEVLDIDIVEDCRLKISGWRSVETLCPYLLQLSSHVHANGFIYWTTSDFQIVSFSLQDETFSTLNPKPPCFRPDTQGSKAKHVFSLFGSHGNLWMVHVMFHIFETWKMEEKAWAKIHVMSHILETWKMEEKAWAKIHTINIPKYPYRGSCFKNDPDIKIIDIRLDQVLFKVSFEYIEWCYDAKTNTLEKHGIPHKLCHSIDGLLSLQNIC